MKGARNQFIVLRVIYVGEHFFDIFAVYALEPLFLEHNDGLCIPMAIYCTKLIFRAKLLLLQGVEYPFLFEL